MPSNQSLSNQSQDERSPGIHSPGNQSPGTGSHEARRDPAPPDQANLIERYRRTGDRRIRNKIVEANMHVADHFVATYSNRSTASRDDLRQTALLALIGAVDRFDPTAGASLSTFAGRTIDGELKRYLRDRTWLVRPPRSTQERYLNVRAVVEELAHQLGRQPNVDEIADRMGIDRDSVVTAVAAGNARSNNSLDRTDDRSSAPSRLVAEIGLTDDGFARADARMSVRTALGRLDDRQQRILRMRFGEELSQPEIAERIGVSQSYVSRIIKGALAALRNDLDLRPDLSATS